MTNGTSDAMQQICSHMLVEGGYDCTTQHGTAYLQ